MNRFNQMVVGLVAFGASSASGPFCAPPCQIGRQRRKRIGFMLETGDAHTCRVFSMNSEPFDQPAGAASAACCNQLLASPAYSAPGLPLTVVRHITRCCCAASYQVAA